MEIKEGGATNAHRIFHIKPYLKVSSFNKHENSRDLAYLDLKHNVRDVKDCQ